MKQHSIFKSSRSLLMGMLGALMPLTAAHALDTQSQDSYDQTPAAETRGTAVQSDQERMIRSEPSGAGVQRTADMQSHKERPAVFTLMNVERPLYLDNRTGGPSLSD